MWYQRTDSAFYVLIEISFDLANLSATHRQRKPVCHNVLRYIRRVCDTHTHIHIQPHNIYEFLFYASHLNPKQTKMLSVPLFRVSVSVEFLQSNETDESRFEQKHKGR